MWDQPRLLKDQQTKRYENRRRLLLDGIGLADAKKLFQDKVSFQVGAQPMNAPMAVADPQTRSETAGSGPGALVDTAASVMFDEKDEETEAAALGLFGDPSKASAKAKAKIKRSRGDMVAEEITKLKSEWVGVVESLSQFPKHPTASDMGKLDRAINRKIREYKDSLDFESVGILQNMFAELDCLRNTLKPALGFTTGTMQTRKSLD